MKNAILTLSLIAIFAATIVGCGSESEFIPPQTMDVYFRIVDDSGDPIPGAFVGVGNQYANLDSASLAFTDSDHQTCPDPDSDEPQLSNHELTYAGCTDADGVVQLRVDFSTSGTGEGINCGGGLIQALNLQLFIKAADGSSAFAYETCNFIHDNTDPAHPENLEVHDLDF